MTMYIEAPNYNYQKIKDFSKTIFLAGTITGAETNWQKFAGEILLNNKFIVFNPRRENFDMTNPSLEREQITWEHKHLELAEIILFYFSYETFAPITLLEYGAMLEAAKTTHYKKIYTAIHPEYKRKNNVIIQTELRNSKFVKNITFNLQETLDQIIKENT